MRTSIDCSAEHMPPLANFVLIKQRSVGGSQQRLVYTHLTREHLLKTVKTRLLTSL